MFTKILFIIMIVGGVYLYNYNLTFREKIDTEVARYFVEFQDKMNGKIDTAVEKYAD